MRRTDSEEKAPAESEAAQAIDEADSSRQIHHGTPIVFSMEPRQFPVVTDKESSTLITLKGRNLPKNGYALVTDESRPIIGSYIIYPPDGTSTTLVQMYLTIFEPFTPGSYRFAIRTENSLTTIPITVTGELGPPVITSMLPDMIEITEESDFGEPVLDGKDLPASKWDYSIDCPAITITVVVVEPPKVCLALTVDPALTPSAYYNLTASNGAGTATKQILIKNLLWKGQPQSG